jgi:hypothetical protein
VNSIDGYEELAAGMDLRGGRDGPGGTMGGQKDGKAEANDATRSKLCEMM